MADFLSCCKLTALFGEHITAVTRILAHALLVLILISLQSCTRSDNHPTPAPPMKVVQSHYIRNDGYSTVVVFVHGVFGDVQSTWQNAKTNAYWPDLLKSNDTFRSADIYVHAFPSPYLKHSFTIDELMENMRAVFDKDAVFRSHKEVVFVCHSMGGLVVRGYLKRYQEDAQKVPLIYFFSTPTDGSHIANLAIVLSANPQLRGMLPSDSNEFLLSMQKDWRAMSVHIFSRCAYETQDTYHVRIVDERSATSLCDGPVTPFALNHIEIVKPENSEDLIFSVFQRAFEERPPPAGAPLILQHIVVPENIRSGQKITVIVPQTSSRNSRPNEVPTRPPPATVIVEPSGGTTRPPVTRKREKIRPVP